jgi:HK97 family phage portal protein
MGLFRRNVEQRAISFQSVWGTGGDWAPESRYGIADGLKLSAVVACVNLRANLIGQLPIAAYQSDKSGQSVAMSPQPRLIEAPSRLPRSYWLRQMSISRDLWGNAFGSIVSRDAAGYPSGVEWLNPAKVEVDESDPVRLQVRYNGQPFPAGDLFIVPGFPVPGSQLGISPLERSGLIELSHRAQDFGRDWFRNGAVPSVMLKASNAELTPEQAEGVRDTVTSNWRKRRPAVIGSGWEVDTIDVKADESQFLDTMRHVQVDICQTFGIPPEEIGIASSGSSVTYANREQRASAILVNTLNAELVLIQEILTASLPRPQYVRFATGALLRSDLAARYQSYATALNGTQPFLTVDEVRQLEDLGPMPPASPTPPAP